MTSNVISRAVVIVAMCVAGGCSQGPKAAPVEPEKARTALRTALDEWKDGRKIESLAELSPPVVAQDFDWMAGAKLTDYSVVGDGTPEDANLRIQAQLKIRDPQGRSLTKTVTYIVGTDPKLTVFRAME